MIYNPDKKHLTMHIKMEQEGHYQATVSYGDSKLKNGDFSILVINGDSIFLECVKKRIVVCIHFLQDFYSLL